VSAEKRQSTLTHSKDKYTKIKLGLTSDVTGYIRLRFVPSIALPSLDPLLERDVQEGLHSSGPDASRFEQTERTVTERTWTIIVFGKLRSTA
jgi:hypothetical protein